MSIVVKIKQIKRMFKEFKKPKVKYYESLTGGRYKFGIPDDAFLVKPYEDDIIRREMLWAYPKNETVKAGRGFGVSTDEFFKFEIVIPTPTTNEDIENGLKFVLGLAEYVNATDIEINGKIEDLKNISIIRYKEENRKELKELVETKSQVGIFTGSFHPVWLFRDDFNDIRKADSMDKIKLLEKYLNSYQKRETLEFEYMVPEFYQNKSNQRIQGIYVMKEGKQMIIPKMPYMPINKVLNINLSSVNEWFISFDIKNKKFKNRLIIPFFEFEKIYSKRIFEKFDEMNYIGIGFDIEEIKEHFGHLNAIKNIIAEYEI